MIKDGDRLRVAAGDKRAGVRAAVAADPQAPRDLLTDPGYPGTVGAGPMGQLETFLGFAVSTQGHFDRADHLGRPIPHGLPEVTGEQLLDRLRELGAG
jgi:hypothetical protein